MTLADEIAAQAKTLAQVPDTTVGVIAAHLTQLAGRVRAMERTLDEIYQNARQEAVTVRAENVVELRKWRGQ